MNNETMTTDTESQIPTRAFKNMRLLQSRIKPKGIKKLRRRPVDIT